MVEDVDPKAGQRGELPAEQLILAGCADLKRGEETIASLLVSIGATRLRRVGYDVRNPFPNAEQRLYAMLSAGDGVDPRGVGVGVGVGDASAHGRYNAFIRRLVSFERAAEAVRPRRAPAR